MTQPFRFRLATVLKLRRATLEQAQRELAERMRALQEADRRILMMGRLIERQTELARAALQPGVLRVEQAAWDRHMLARLSREFQEQSRQREGLAVEAERFRGRLNEALKAVRVLEEMETRQREAHGREIFRRERIEEDERAVLQFAHADEETSSTGSEAAAVAFGE